MAVAYAGTYLLAVIASRLLSNSQYGVFAALLAVLTVVTVPGLALQAVIARRCATRVLTLGETISIGLVVGLGCAALAALALPPLDSFLHIGTVGGMAAALGATVPLTVLSAIQGWLQGNERFGGLAVVVLLAGAAKLVGGLVPLVVGGDADASLIGVTGVTAVVTAVIACSPRLGNDRLVSRRPRLRQAIPLIPWSEVGPAAVGFGGLLLISNLDLLLARHVLSGSASGRYAAATVVAKVALWIPQAIALAVLPRLARGDNRTATLRAALLATSVIGVLGCLVMLGLGTTAMRISFGPRYASLGPIAWVFALQGSALALTQLTIVADIARARRGVLRLVLWAAALEAATVLVVQPRTIRGLVTIAASCAGVLALLATGQVARRRQGLRSTLK